MDKFSSTLRGYDKNEVNAFIDDIIARVESMVKELEDKNKRIANYKKQIKKDKLVIKKLTEQIEVLKEPDEFSKEYDQTMENLERAKIDTKTIIDNANEKSRKIIAQAEENADVIINECLMQAKKQEMELNILKNEINRLKQKKETLY